MIFITHSAEETIKLGNIIGSMLKPGDILALKGTLAAGKTTFTKGIAKALDISETITSPTFTLISEYSGKYPLYHFDVYRIDTIDDFIGLGSEDLIYGKGISVIEWSEKIFSELPKNTISILFETLPNEERKITIDNWKYENIVL